jgi:hypothetical protein
VRTVDEWVVSPCVFRHSHHISTCLLHPVGRDERLAERCYTSLVGIGVQRDGSCEYVDEVASVLPATVAADSVAASVSSRSRLP